MIKDKLEEEIEKCKNAITENAKGNYNGCIHGELMDKIRFYKHEIDIIDAKFSQRKEYFDIAKERLSKVNTNGGSFFSSQP